MYLTIISKMAFLISFVSKMPFSIASQSGQLAAQQKGSSLMTRLYDAPFGQVQEFLKRLANAGFTQEEMIRLTNHPIAMKEWVEALGFNVASDINPDTPVETILGDRRLCNSLRREFIHTIGDLVDWTEDELLDVRNCGSRSVDVIKSALGEHGLSLADRPHHKALVDHNRIYNRLESGYVVRPWRRADIGRLPLSLFVDFTAGEDGSRYVTGVPNRIRGRIEELASLTTFQLSERYGRTTGPLIADWIDENYRDWRQAD